MAGWIRRNWIPTAGMAVAVAFVAWLAWINVRGSGSGSAGPTPSARVSGSPSASASASASADPAQAQVEAAAKRWVQAYADAYRTGDAAQLDSLTVPDSQAQGEAGGPRNDVTHSHKTFLVSAVQYSAISSTVVAQSATVDITVQFTGVDATWPALTPLGAQRNQQQHFVLQLELVGSTWLVDHIA